jgi:hypothetical protein
MVNGSFLLLAATLRLFGSAGAEWQWTPSNAGSPLNPGNVARVPSQTNVGDITVFVEAISAERRWKARVKVRGDASDRGADRLRANEAFAQFRLHERVDVTAGRVIEKWGTGYGWNPTAFASPAKDPTDPNDRRAAYAGVDMLRVDAFVKDTNVSLYVLSGGATAARIYRLVGATDVSVALHHDDGRMKGGVSVSRVFGDSLELHAEAARSEDVVWAVAGGQYTFAGDFNAVFEIYYGGDGLTTAEWAAFRVEVDDALRLHDGEALLRANRRYAPLRMGRAYAFARLFRPFDRSKSSAELIAIASLRDGSSIFRLTLDRKLRANLTAYLIVTEFAGGAPSELSYIQIARAAAAGLRLHF